MDKKDIEIAEMAHRYAIAKVMDSFVVELGEFLRGHRVDPIVLRELSGRTFNRHSGILSTPDGLHISLAFDVRYGSILSEKEYQEEADKAKKTWVEKLKGEEGKWHG